MKTRLSAAILMALLSTFALTVIAQNPPLSLADLLIGLRSKKATIEERNQILAKAVQERGVTFVNSAEIEKELASTGADAALIAAVRVKGQPAKPAATPAPKPAATPVATPTPVDFTYYQKRADASLIKGEPDSALADYNTALAMKADEPNLFVGRGRVHFSLKSYDLSVKDYDRAIELSPKTAIAFLNRGASYEKLGAVTKALADYKKASDLDSTNETAIAEIKRIEDALAIEAAAKAAAVKPVEVAAPEFLNLGSLSSANAVRLVTPTYSPMARQSRVVGKVVVDVTLDTEGNVVLAKASSGHAMLRQSAEDAAKRSKFKPVMFSEKPIKAKGVITYNFSL